jgi:glycosyltransferase involved in cell wall biosynthesis
MKCGVPVIGLVPNMVPEWMNEDNGIWINNQNMVVDVISDFIQNWLEDNINPELYTTMESSVSKVTNKSDFDNNVVSIFGKMISTRIESFSEQLNKLETIE